jgi:hypothetical protein
MEDISSFGGNCGISGCFPQCLGHGHKALVDAPEARSHHEVARLEGPPFCLGVGSVPEVAEFVNKQGSNPLAIRDFDTMPTIIPQYALFSKKYGTNL